LAACNKGQKNLGKKRIIPDLARNCNHTGKKKKNRSGRNEGRGETGE